MRFIPTRLHGYADYVLGLLMLALPYLFGFADGSREHWLVMLLGVVTISYSLVTSYECGLIRGISMRLHLSLDLVAGVVLLLSPHLVPSAAHVWLPQTVLGAVEILSALLTRLESADGHIPVSSLGGLGDGMPHADAPHSDQDRPATELPASGASNVDQLRRAIDSGNTGDKVAVLDPATVPLGTDDEAASPHDEAGLATARSRSRSR